MKQSRESSGTHNTLWVVVIIATLAVAAVAAYLGAAVYALTTGAKAIGNYLQDRRMALCLFVFATALNFLAASLFSRRHRIGPFLMRVPISLLMTACGAALVLGLILAYAMISKGTWSV